MNTAILAKLEKQFSLVGKVNQYPDGTLKFVTYSNHTIPIDEGIKIDGDTYKCIKVTDVTTDKESDEGLSYSEIGLEKI